MLCKGIFTQSPAVWSDSHLKVKGGLFKIT